MLKTIRFAALAVGATLLSAPARAHSSPVVGKWATAVESDFGKFEALMTVAQEGSSYTVEIQDVQPDGAQGPGPMPGKITDVVIDGSKFSFKRQLTTPQGELSLNYTGSVEGDTLNGEVGSDFGSMKLAGTRQ